jgi:hypothetical protein
MSKFRNRGFTFLLHALNGSCLGSIIRGEATQIRRNGNA